jgi:nickel/cobalt homeostasis protein
MKNSTFYGLTLIGMMFLPTVAFADNAKWGASVGVNVGNYPHNSYPNSGYPHTAQTYPQNRPYPPRPPHGVYPPASHGGVSFNYQAPSYTTYNHQTYTWVNGDPNVAQIKSSEYIVIADWRKLGLPAPPDGMHWIYEEGRYILQPNN